MVGVSALATWVTACDQPTIDCRTLHVGPYAAKYTLISGGPECSDLKGERIGLQSYYAPNSDSTNVDLSRSYLAIRPDTLGVIDDEATIWGDEKTVTKSTLSSIGDFASVDPNEKDTCSVPSLSPAEIAINAIPPNMEDPEDLYEGRDATDIRYEWKNVRVLVSPGAPGNLIEADLTYTQDGCTANYSVIALWPTIDCEKREVMTDMNGKPVVVRTGEPNDDLCDDQADLQAPYGLPTGSGISQDFVPKCDPDLLYCVATKTDLIEGGP